MNDSSPVVRTWGRVVPPEAVASTDHCQFYDSGQIARCKLPVPQFLTCGI